MFGLINKKTLQKEISKERLILTSKFNKAIEEEKSSTQTLIKELQTSFKQELKKVTNAPGAPAIIGKAIPHTEKSTKIVDATEWCQGKIDKGEVIPTGNFFTSAPLQTTSQTIEMSGNGFLFYDVHDWKKDIKHNNYVTAIMPTGNFNAIEINGKYAGVNKGLIYTGFAENHSKAGVYFNTNNRIQYNALNGLSIDGKWSDMTKTGVGTIAVDFEMDIDDDLKSEYGGYIDLINTNFKYCAKGINLEKKTTAAALKSHLFVNSISGINLKMFGCKQFLNLEWGSNMAFWNMNLHDFPVLNKDEAHLFAIVAEVSKSDFYYQIYDTSNGPRDTKGLFRHNRNEFKISDANRKTTSIINRFVQGNNKRTMPRHAFNSTKTIKQLG